MPSKLPRLLVVDANILFSFFRQESFTRELVKSLYLRGIKLFIPDFGLDELLSLKERICEFCRIDEDEFMTSFALLCEILKSTPKEEYESSLLEAKNLLPEHPKDVPYFALALAFNYAIWSNEKRFK
jgi:predicted nucleic acid-binding protein